MVCASELFTIATDLAYSVLYSNVCSGGGLEYGHHATQKTTGGPTMPRSNTGDFDVDPGVGTSPIRGMEPDAFDDGVVDQRRPASVGQQHRWRWGTGWTVDVVGHAAQMRYWRGSSTTESA